MLASYFRPKYLYQMLLASGAERTFGNIEAWFKSSGCDEYREGKQYRMPLAVAKMRHPYTRLRLRPLEDDIRDRRTYLVLSLLRSRFKELIPGVLDEDGISASIADTFPWQCNNNIWECLLAAWKSSLRTYRCLGNRTARGVVKTSHEVKNGLKSETLRQMAKNEVPRTNGQKEFEVNFGTQIPILLQTIRRCKLRAAIIFFGWKVVNRKIHADLVGRNNNNDKPRCSWCGHRLTTRHILNILNGECGRLRDIHGHYERLLQAPHNRQTIREELVQVWSVWKAWCRMVHDNLERNSDTFVTLYREILSTNKVVRNKRPLIKICSKTAFLRYAMKRNKAWFSILTGVTAPSRGLASAFWSVRPLGGKFSQN